MFVAEAQLLRRAFEPEAVRIEHIGSTSVPGMAAKPIIDILLGAASLESIEVRIVALGACGY
ncbi:MAG TPA: GrpB family protein, partial [Usitatibacter sp.]|nr:GrpB family protein [Usitatibacter sp.]